MGLIECCGLDSQNAAAQRTIEGIQIIRVWDYANVVFSSRSKEMSSFSTSTSSGKMLTAPRTLQ